MATDTGYTATLNQITKIQPDIRYGHRYRIYGYSESDNEDPARYLVWPQTPDIRLL